MRFRGEKMPKGKRKGIWIKHPVDKLRRRMQGVHLENGGGTMSKKTVCLMELGSVITGSEHTDHPPCVSRVMTEFGIALNDSRKTQKERDKLKTVLPVMLGTAPTKFVKQTADVWNEKIGDYTRQTGWWEMQDENDKNYQRVEEQRIAILRGYLGADCVSEGGWIYIAEPIRLLPTSKAIKIMREMAAVQPKNIKPIELDLTPTVNLKKPAKKKKLTNRG